jgi:hypothetical protein
MKLLASTTACAVLLVGCGHRSERVVGIVVTLEVESSVIIELATPALPKLGMPISGAQITVGENSPPAVFEGNADGTFEVSTIGAPPAEKGSPRSLKVTAPGYEPASTQYLAFPQREGQYFLVVLKKAA